MKPLFLVLLVSASSALAAIPPKIDSSQAEALEILAMPEANRFQIAGNKGMEIYPELIQISKSENQSMDNRWKALTLAAYVGKDEAVADLEAQLKSKEWFMRNAALISLKIHHPVKAQEAAKQLLKDKALVVRSAAVEVLGTQLDSTTRNLLWDELKASYNFRKNQSLWIRKQILSQLAEKPEASESRSFIAALNEKEESLHAPAVAALENLTHQKLGEKATLGQKRELWLQWAKAHSLVSTQ